MKKSYIFDALITACCYAGPDLPGFDQEAADVSGNGAINIVDTLQIAQYYAGQINQFITGCVQASTPTPPAIIPGTVFSVNCGGSAYMGSDDTEYAADTGYSGGSAFSHMDSVSETKDEIIFEDIVDCCLKVDSIE